MTKDQSTDPIVYIPVPVSELPAETGFYFTHLPHPLRTNEYVKHVAEYMNGSWNTPGYFYKVLEWLKPVPLSSITNERIKELEAEVKRLAYLADYWQEKKK